MSLAQGLAGVGPDDATVVRRVLAGDVDAYAVLVARYRDRFARFAQRMLGDVEDAEEAMQDAFVRAYRSLRNCKDPARFGSWFYRILANRCRTHDALRRRRARTFVRDEIALQSAGAAPAFDGGAWREEIERALARLDPLYREAFLLKHVEELEYEEMERVTGAGVSALKMRVKRACDRLRELLEEVHSEAR